MKSRIRILNNGEEEEEEEERQTRARKRSRLCHRRRRRRLIVGPLPTFLDLEREPASERERGTRRSGPFLSTEFRDLGLATRRKGSMSCLGCSRGMFEGLRCVPLTVRASFAFEPTSRQAAEKHEVSYDAGEKSEFPLLSNLPPFAVCTFPRESITLAS